MNNRDEIINKLFANQIDTVDPKYRLNTKDIIRLSSYIGSDPFSETECCKWKGAISKSSHQSKYINFWFNKKKQALHRILYLNYKGELPKNKYLRFSCPNTNMRGICCNINHLDLINKEDDNYKENEYKENDYQEKNDLNNNEKEIVNKIDQNVDNNLNQQLGTTAKSKKTTKNNSNQQLDTIINPINNLQKKDIFVIVFED
jgi:hypothetical protein